MRKDLLFERTPDLGIAVEARHGDVHGAHQGFALCGLVLE
jgi:hypothetical protein